MNGVCGVISTGAGIVDVQYCKLAIQIFVGGGIVRTIYIYFISKPSTATLDGGDHSQVPDSSHGFPDELQYREEAELVQRSLLPVSR